MTTWTEMSYNSMGREYEEDVLDFVLPHNYSQSHHTGIET